MKTAIAIRHIAFEDLGTFEDVLLAQGFEIRYVEAGRDDLSTLDAREPALLVLLGGPIGAYEENLYPFLSDEMRLAEQRLSAGLPLLGICLGAQIMARALGARVYPGRAKEIGWTALTLSEAGRFGPTAHLSPELTSMLHWHGDTFDLPPGATLLASTPLTKNQVYAWGDCALASQCHPEIRAQLIERWLVGHAGELAHAGVSPTALREATLQFGPALEVQGRKCFEQWLAETGA
jgi:GMP synthase (glutamine-hydrolysing)